MVKMPAYEFRRGFCTLVLSLSIVLQERVTLSYYTVTYCSVMQFFTTCSLLSIAYSQLSLSLSLSLILLYRCYYSWQVHMHVVGSLLLTHNVVHSSEPTVEPLYKDTEDTSLNRTPFPTPSLLHAFQPLKCH